METAIQKYRREQKELKRKRRDMYLTDAEWSVIQEIIDNVRKDN